MIYKIITLTKIKQFTHLGHLFVHNSHTDLIVREPYESSNCEYESSVYSYHAYVIWHGSNDGPECQFIEDEELNFSGFEG